MLHRRPLLKITWLGLLLALLGATECEELFELQFVSIDGPAEMTFTEAQTVTITASALEGEGLAVEEVRFYRDGRLTGSARTKPYTRAWPITADDNGIHRWHAGALYRHSDGKTELLRSDEVVYEVAIGTSEPITSLRIGSDPLTGIAVSRTLAVTVSPTRLTAIDTSSNSPRILGSVGFPGLLMGVRLSSQYAYVLQDVKGPAFLHVVDLRDPANPVAGRRIQLFGEYANIGGGGLAVEDGTLYVATLTGLELFALDDPASPRLVGTVDIERATAVAVSRGIAFVSTFGDTFHVIDVSDPRNPGVITDLGLNRADRMLAFDGVLIVTGFQRLAQILDVSNPRAVRWLRNQAVFALDVAVAGDLAYFGMVPDQGESVAVFDLNSEGLHPLKLEPTGAWARSLDSDGARIIAGDQEGNLLVLDTSR